MKEIKETNFNHILKSVPGEDANDIPFICLVAKYYDQKIIEYVCSKTNVDVTDSKGNWPIHYAAMSGNYYSIYVFEKQQKKQNDEGMHPIATYMMSGPNRDVLMHIIDYLDFLSPVTPVDIYGNVLLHYVCMYGDLDCSSYIRSIYLRKCKDEYYEALNQQNDDGLIPCQMAVLKNNLSVLRGFGSEITFRGIDDPISELLDFVYRMDYPTIKYVIEKVGISQDDLYPPNILITAAQRGYSTDLLIFIPCEFYEAANFNDIILTAIENGNEEMAFSLYRNAKEVPNLDGLTTLSAAAKYGLVMLIHRLIEYGVSPIEVDENGKTAAHFAMEE